MGIWGQYNDNIIRNNDENDVMNIRSTETRN